MAKDLEATIGYCRVSTQRQFTEGHGLERYIEALKRYGLREDQIYYDIESGSSDRRVGYTTVLNLIRTGKFKKLVIPCFDRFTRSPLHWEQARLEFEKFGITLEFLDGGELDFSSPDGIFTSRILAAMAAQTREKNRYNSIQGHKFLRSQQKPLIACFGYIKDGDSLIVNRNIYKDTGLTYHAIARETIETFLQNRTLSGTLRILCQKYGYERLSTEKHSDFPRSPHALKTWLLHPQLRGHLVYHWKDESKRIEIPHKYEAILQDAEYSEILSIFKQRHGTRYRRYDISNPLLGLCFCAKCGSPMKHSTTSRGKGQSKVTYHYLFCFGAYPFSGKPQVCDQRSTYGLTVEKAVARVIEEICTKAGAIASQVFDGSDTPENIETSEMLELRRQIERLELLDDPDLAEIILQKKTKLNLLKENAKVGEIQNVKQVELLRELAATPQFWELATVDELYVVFQDLVKRVECDRGNLNVTLNV